MKKLVLCALLLTASHALKATEVLNMNDSLLKPCQKSPVNDMKADDSEIWIEFEDEFTATKESVLEKLQSTPGVTHLGLSSQYLGDEVLKEISESDSITNVRYVYLSQFGLTDEGVASLRNFSPLYELCLSKNKKLTSQGLASVPLSEMRGLWLNFIGLNNTDLELLLTAPKLEELYVAGSNLDHSALPVLEQFSSLKVLDVSYNNFLAQDLSSLSSTLPNTKILNRSS